MKIEEKFSQIKQWLNVVEDDRRILQCKRRLENAPIRSDSKCPILLPSDHHVTRLIIKQCHRMVMHNRLRTNPSMNEILDIERLTNSKEGDCKM